MIDPAAAPLTTGRACAPEQEEPAAAPKAPANNLEQFCLLMCRGLEVKKVSVHTSNKTPYSRIIWMHGDRSRFCIGKSKNANDAIDIPFTAIEEILRDAVPQRFTLVTGARSLSLDVDTANSRNILVRMIGSVVAHYRAAEGRRAEEQAAFKASLASSSLSSSAGEADCAICLGPVDGPLQLRCGHTFCAGCIELWRATAEGAPSCPSCREPLPPSASEKLDRAAAFLAMRTGQPAKASPAKTARSGAKKAARAMALVVEAHAINPMARASVAGGYRGATPMCMAAATDGGDATVRALAACEAEVSAATSTVNVP